MKITIRLGDSLGGGTREAELPYDAADHVVAEGACPACKAAPFAVRGRGVNQKTFDEYRATAECCGCGATLGTLVAEVSTIFGIEEDERVLLHGRCRVY